MDAHLQATRGKVIAHLYDTLLHFGRIQCADYVLPEAIVMDFLRLVLIGKHEHRLVVLAEDVINIDAYEYFDFPDGCQLPAQPEITGGSEKAGNGKEGVEILHVTGNSL